MPPQSVSLIVEHGYVLTMDPANRVIADGAIAIDGHSIVAVGPTSTVHESYAADSVIDARGMAVLPGLVDTYGHAGHGLVRAIYHPRHGWPNNAIYFSATPAWWYAEGMLAAVERLRFGVTCGFSVVGATPARMDSPVFASRQAEAVRDVGIRGVLGVGPPDPFVSHLPEPWIGTLWEDGVPVERVFTFEDAVRNSAAVIESWHGGADGRVHVAIHYPYLLGRLLPHPRIPFTPGDEHAPVMLARAEEMRDLATRHGVLLHTHAFRGSVSFARAKFGADRLARLLGPDVIFAHCNDLAPDEIEDLGRAGVGIAVVPYTHENVFYGPCPAVELLEAGANVTISTDGTAPYASYDLLKEVSRALWAQWMRFHEVGVLPPGKALRMITIDAARALGLDHLIGSLEVGKRADVILLDLNRPHLTPHTHIPRLLAFYANGNDVHTVIVDGQILLRERRVLSVDEESVLAMAREEAARAFARADIDRFLEMDERFWQGARY